MVMDGGAGLVADDATSGDQGLENGCLLSARQAGAAAPEAFVEGHAAKEIALEGDVAAIGSLAWEGEQLRVGAVLDDAEIGEKIVGQPVRTGRIPGRKDGAADA